MKMSCMSFEQFKKMIEEQPKRSHIPPQEGLIILKQLLDSGLITPQVYDEKVSEIMNKM